VKLKWFASVLSERVSLNDYIPLVEYVSIARHIWYSQVIRLCQLVSNPDKKLPGEPKLHCRNFLQTGAVARFINIWLGVYPADSRKACCEVCNNTEQIIAKHVNFKGMLGAKSTQTRSKNLLCFPNVNSTNFWVTETRLRKFAQVEAVLTLFVAEHCSTVYKYMWPFERDCWELFVIQKGGKVSYTYVAQNVDRKNCGPKLVVVKTNILCPLQ